MRASRVLLISSTLVGLGAPWATADLVRLPGGGLRGIIVEETDSRIRLQFAWRGFLTLEKSSIRSITREDAQAHETLLAQWKADHEEAQRREQEQQAFEAAQAARGLVKYKGRWVAQEQMASIEEAQRQEREREQADRERRQRQEREAAEREQISRRLQALEDENASLRQRLWASPSVAFIPQPVVVRRPLPLPGEAVYQDEQGNLIRVGQHDHHVFMTASDGTHIDLERHDGHLAFTDQQGQHHDLRRFSPPLVTHRPFLSTGGTEIVVDVLGQ